MSNSQTVPAHLGLILDGNRRWAKAQGMKTLEGHRAGYDNLKEITKEAINSGVKYVSAYIFSMENWNRTPDEVKYLMDLAHRMVTKDIRELDKEGIRVVWLGSRIKISDKLLKAIEKAEFATKDNTRGTLALCFNYGGHEELVDAVKQIVDLNISSEDVNQDVLAQNLYAPEVPPVDFMIRTSGEQRISGFMLHRIAYAELYFSDKFWPDFSNDDLHEALAEYACRQRRFGA